MIFIPGLVHFAKICQNLLVADDPLQYRSLTTEELIALFWVTVNEKKVDQTLINEINYRLTLPNLSLDEKEILEKMLGNVK